jgi:hypothetical protein
LAVQCIQLEIDVAELPLYVRDILGKLGELTRPQNRPVLRLRESPLLQDLANGILRKVHRLKPIQV